LPADYRHLMIGAVDRTPGLKATHRVGHPRSGQLREHGVGKTVLLNAASEAASAAGVRVLRAAGVEYRMRPGMAVSSVWPIHVRK
jgi:hypothetical protein